MITVDHREKLKLIDHFKAALSDAMTERDRRPDLVQTNNGVEVEWVVFERERMLAGVNVCRAEYGLPPVSAAEVERVERQAEGHVDYHARFALYCAELVLGEDRRVW